MPEAGPLDVQPDKVAPALIVDSAAAPTIDSFRKSRRSDCIGAASVPTVTGPSSSLKTPIQACGLRTKYSLMVTLVIFQIGRKAATLCIMIAMFLRTSSRFRAP